MDLSNSVALLEPKKQTRRLAQVFLLVSLIFGLLYIYLEPPFVCPDENAHLINIYRISHGHIFADVENGQVGSCLSAEEFDYISRYGGIYNGSEGIVYDYQTVHELSTREASNELIFVPSKHATINPLPYLLPACGVFVVRLILQILQLGGLNAYNAMLISKFVNLLFYSFVISWAIRRTGALKKTMFLLALMPMAIFQGASTSYDASLIASAFLLFAFVTKNLLTEADERIGKEDIIAICISTAFLVGDKIAYAPLLLVLFSIPFRKFGGRRRYFGCICAVLVVVVICYIFPTLINTIRTSGIQTELTDLQIAQNDFVSQNPEHLPVMMIRTIQHFGGYWLESFFGILGWLDTYFPVAFVVLFFIISTATAVFEVCQINKVAVSARILFFGGVFIFLTGTLYMMYAKWNPELVGIVGGDLAYGGQGRYFIPVSLFTVFIFSNPLLSRVRNAERYENNFERLVELTSVGYLCLTALILITRYWI